MIIDTCYHTQLLNLPALKESLSLLHSQGPQCCSVLMKNEPQATANSTARWHRPRYHLFYAIRKTRPIWWWCRLAHWPTPESKAQSHHEKLFRRLPLSLSVLPPSVWLSYPCCFPTGHSCPLLLHAHLKKNLTQLVLNPCLPFHDRIDTPTTPNAPTKQMHTSKKKQSMEQSLAI